MTKGMERYFRDLTSIFNAQKWHWAFYSFREDEWDGMNYELGAKPLGEKYWKDVYESKKLEPRYDDFNPIWTTLKTAMKATASTDAESIIEK